MWSLFSQGDGEFLYCFRPHAARMHYRHHSLDLLTGRKLPGGVKAFLDTLGEIPLNATFAKPKVLHMNYELGHLFQGLDDFIPGHMPLAVEIEYLKARRLKLHELWPKFSRPQLKFLQIPTWDDYRKGFDRVQEELLQGNCYQVNFTAPFYLMWEGKYRPQDFIRTLWEDPAKTGAYAHATWLSTTGKLFLSNTPECLVQRHSFKASEALLYSMPIKGTLPLPHPKEFDATWKEMCASSKEESELNMITDLIRNDLSKVAKPRAKIVATRKPLQVPGLLHQYALVSCPVPNMTSWKRVLECLFPGGSVTGAPKKRVMEIIHHLEVEPRGSYCGSTWFAYGKTLAGSINIRTAELDMALKEMKYAAGGGITLQSKASNEFEEMFAKSQSFLTPFVCQKIAPQSV